VGQGFESSLRTSLQWEARDTCAGGCLTRSLKMRTHGLSRYKLPGARQAHRRSAPNTPNTFARASEQYMVIFDKKGLYKLAKIEEGPIFRREAAYLDEAAGPSLRISLN
jgi:hypothetical protein